MTTNKADYDYRPHDYLWVRELLFDAIPSWWRQIDYLRPVVVRRDRREDLIPVGLRGVNKRQRFCYLGPPGASD